MASHAAWRPLAGAAASSARLAAAKSTSTPAIAHFARSRAAVQAWEAAAGARRLYLVGAGETRRAVAGESFAGGRVFAALRQVRSILLCCQNFAGVERGTTGSPSYGDSRGVDDAIARTGQVLQDLALGTDFFSRTRSPEAHFLPCLRW